MEDGKWNMEDGMQKAEGNGYGKWSAQPGESSWKLVMGSCKKE
jgi:hypothetical protein